MTQYLWTDDKAIENVPAEDRAWLIRTWANARFSPIARNEISTYIAGKGWNPAVISEVVRRTPEYRALVFRPCAAEGCPNHANWLDYDGEDRCDEHHVTPAAI